MGGETVPVTKLETAVLEKFKAAIDRGHHLPQALKDMATDELGHLKASIEDVLRERRGSATLDSREPARYV